MDELDAALFRLEVPEVERSDAADTRSRVPEQLQQDVTFACSAHFRGAKVSKQRPRSLRAEALVPRPLLLRNVREVDLLREVLLVGLFAFVTVWPFYPETGAVLTFAGVVLALLAPVRLPFWTDYAWIGSRGLALLGALVALDDVAEHAFGIPTPLDWVWGAHIVQHIN